MRFSILAVLPILLGVAYANYYVDCDDDNGHRESYDEPMHEGEMSECKKFNYGMHNFDCYQDDGYSYKFEFYDDDKCEGNKHEKKVGGKNKKEKKEEHKEEEECWSYYVYCEGEGDD